MIARHSPLFVFALLLTYFASKVILKVPLKEEKMMSEYNRSSYYDSTAGSLQQYMTKVFTRMGISLGITAVVAFAGYISLINGGFMFRMLVNMPFMIWVLFFAQLGACIALSAGLTRFNSSTVSLLFYGYAVLTGINFSTLPLRFGLTTVFTGFLFAAVMFISCAVIGATTDKDLTKFGTILMAGLIAMVLASVLAIFIPVLRNNLLFSYIGVALFLGITAFDTQRIKAFYYGTNPGETIHENLATFAAFQLYLDFINIFLYILRILGNGRNNK